MGVPAVRSQQWHQLRVQFRIPVQSLTQISFYSAVGLPLLFLIALMAVLVFDISSVAYTSLLYPTVLTFRTDVLIGVVVGGNYLQEAQERVEDERESVTAERDAFLEFANQVKSISHNTGSRNAMTVYQGTTENEDRQLQQIRNQYQETILSLPDHDQAYDESFKDHVVAEFGTEIASALLGGQHFTSQTKQLLVRQAKESAQQREQLLDAIVTEEQSLRRAEKEFEPVANCLDSLENESFYSTDFEVLIETDEDFRKHCTSCEQVLQTRQQKIRTITWKTGGQTNGSFQDYLYTPFEATFPVLNTALNYIKKLNRQQFSVRRVLARKD